MKILEGRTALITGAGGGLGTAFVRALVAEGMNVAATDLDLGRAEAVAADYPADRVRPFHLDVTDFAEWARVADEAEAALGQIRLFVSNAGIGAGCIVAEDDPRRWKLVLDVNAYGPFLGCRTLLPRMLKRGDDSHIVFMASMAGLLSNPSLSSYDASKHALVGLAGSLRGELADGPVGVSLVLPGVIATEFTKLSQEVIGRVTGSTTRAQNVGALHQSGMDPNAVVRRVIAAIKAREYYVFTHADWRDRLQAAHDERIAAIGDSADPDWIDSFAGLDAAIRKNLDEAKPASGQS